MAAALGALLRRAGAGALRAGPGARAAGVKALEGVGAPRVDPAAFVAPGAAVVGDVRVGARSSVWYGCVVRGDVNRVEIGADTNVQDGTVIHVAKTNLKGDDLPTVIGDRVTIGHCALLHACRLEDESFIGMRATVLDGAVVESGAMVAAGALVTAGKRVPSGELWAGSPAKFFRKLKPEEVAFFRTSAEKYAELGQQHKGGLSDA